MNVTALQPEVQQVLPFVAAALRHVPEAPGCYALCAWEHTVLYIGRAGNLRRRLAQHLKGRGGQVHPSLGYALTFHWRPFASEALAQLERGWMNHALLVDGALPPWNRVYAGR